MSTAAERRAVFRKADGAIAGVMRIVAGMPPDIQGVFLGIVWRALRHAMSLPREQWPSVTSMTAGDALDAAAEEASK